VGRDPFARRPDRRSSRSLVPAGRSGADPHRLNLFQEDNMTTTTTAEATIDRPTEATNRPSTPPRQAGPPLVLPALSFALLFLAGSIFGTSPPLPTASAAEVLAYYREQQQALTVPAFFQFAAAIPLAVFAATAFSRLRRLGADVPGAAIGLVGGVLAAASLALCGLLGWVGSRAALLDDAAVVYVVRDLTFMTGGVGHVAPLGLLFAGLAVPGLLGRLLPRWLAWLGIVLAVIAGLSTLSLLTPTAMVALPLARFLGFAWLIAVGALLPRAARSSSSAAGR
jgi:hypothetical protein